MNGPDDNVNILNFPKAQ